MKKLLHEPSPAEIDTKLMRMVEAGYLVITGKDANGNNLYATTEKGRLEFQKKGRL
jgi:DNA-binding PadR family transcriptional regulator